MEQILNQILSKLDSLENEMKLGFEEVNGKIDSLQEQVAGNTETINRIETKLDTTHEQVVLNSEAINALQLDVTTLKDNQQTIMQIQQDQQRTQELLAVRSINHEADIKEIRRIK